MEADGFITMATQNMYQIKHFAGKSPSDFSNTVLFLGRDKRESSMPINANAFEQLNSDLQGGLHSCKIHCTSVTAAERGDSHTNRPPCSRNNGANNTSGERKIVNGRHKRIKFPKGSKPTHFSETRSQSKGQACVQR